MFEPLAFRIILGFEKSPFMLPFILSTPRISKPSIKPESTLRSLISALYFIPFDVDLLRLPEALTVRESESTNRDLISRKS